VKAGLEDTKAALLVMIGVLTNGQKVVLVVESGQRKSKESWSMLLRDLRTRGLKPWRCTITAGHHVRAQPFSLPGRAEKSTKTPCAVPTVEAKIGWAQSFVMSAPPPCRRAALPAERRIESGQNSAMSARLLSQGCLQSSEREMLNL
jgi:hypothetical protein